MNGPDLQQQAVHKTEDLTMEPVLTVDQEEYIQYLSQLENSGQQ